ncbi:FAD-binding oxidoreductase [Jannaschia sp. S6380]|uniref:FAD-binding oxidoreductase n=1 Tax=Jannaschia sp. S6380 TaxID=2926408 RepID=UPI001FF55AED|nr:FAD-binding oxidoreductase [Jannaschia sp. S6380]MCK0167209.1 FAD-binding oxidoreductase [Jannaschia sp. S6380]
MTLSPADGAFLEHLDARLLPGTIQPVEPWHAAEPRRLLVGTARAVATPRTVTEVQRIVRACAEHRVGLIPHGGWTGLVGGQLGDGVPPLLLSTRRLDGVRALHPAAGTATVGAGTILQDLHATAEEADLIFPLTLGSRGSARIGGLLSTNAGGTAVLRYGTMRDLTLGVEAVLPDGALMATAHRLRKSNVGYDLRNLLIGAEGTLGVITAATLRLFPKPAHVASAFLAIPRPGAALDLLARLRRRVGDQVTGCELIDGQGLRWVAEHLPQVRTPLADAPDWSVLVEVSGFDHDPTDTLEAVAAAAMEEGLVGDGVVARSEGQRADFWALRDAIPEANRAIGPVASHDVSVPLECVPDLITEGRAAMRTIAPDLRFNTFGHVGDGNLHYNLFPAAGRTRADYAEIRAELSSRLHDLVVAMGGAISAEHGIGRLKAGEMARLHDPAALAAMRTVKDALDPHGIMNPGAILAART